MQALPIDQLSSIPARMEDIPLYVKSEDTDGEVSHRAICSANDNCTLCPLYKSDGVHEDCLY